MIAHLSVILAAFLAAGLTMYSGFGLGTLLLPVFALFFPAEMAVVATAMVHGANNVFKVSLLGRFADREVVLKFGLPAIAAAILGALALGWFAASGSDLTVVICRWVVCCQDSLAVCPVTRVRYALPFWPKPGSTPSVLSAPTP